MSVKEKAHQEYMAVVIKGLQSAAKQRWPDDPDGDVNWRMHVQRLVVSEDPKGYLEKN